MSDDLNALTQRLYAQGYGRMAGRVETNGEALFFRKKRSRKYVYRLTDTEVLSISWQLSVQT